MQRRFSAAALLVAITALLAPSVRGAGPVTIKLATLAPTGTSYHRILQQMGESWKTAPDGGVTLRIFAGGTQGSEVETVTRMRLGQLQAAMLTAGGLAEIDPAVAALQEIPMLFSTLAEEEYVREKMRPGLERRLLAKGFVAIFWGDSGWVHFFSRTAATRPNDFKPMKVFVTASGGAKEMEIMQALGYRPVAFDWADALTQMETGNIDAVPTMPVLALSGQYYRAMKHVTQVNWVPLVGATVVTKTTWDSLTPAARAALTTSAIAAGKQIQDASRRENDEALETLKTKLKVEVHPLSAQVQQEWRAFAESVYPRIRGTLVPADVFDEARRLVSEYRAAQAAR
jgi:TRAP-type C4-dicarboxylate transport system substrate-binding protein